jgi:predicted ATPase
MSASEGHDHPSTIVEALAEVYPRTGALATYGHIAGPTASAEDSPLPRHLRARTHPLASPHGFFLRAERMHAYLARSTPIRPRRAAGRASGCSSDPTASRS